MINSCSKVSKYYNVTIMIMITNHHFLTVYTDTKFINYQSLQQKS
jgi:hypothetical protein